MISLKLFLEAIHDKPTDEENEEMFNLHGVLSKHYRFGARSIERDVNYSLRLPETNPPDNKHIDNIHTYTIGQTPNSYLWDKDTYKYKPIDKHREVITNRLNEALHFHKTPKDMTVYSSSIHDPSKMKNSEGIFHHPAFMSTTIDKEYAKDWENKDEDDEGNRHHHILAIHVPKGSPGAYAEHITQCRGQHEFILPSGSNFKYHHTESVPTKDREGSITNHYHHVSLEPESK